MKPFNELVNCNCSQAMLSLMNSFRYKPSFILYNGYLYVWVNWQAWKDTEPCYSKLSFIEPQPYVELELFRAYKAYYELLQKELPYPFVTNGASVGNVDNQSAQSGQPANRAAHGGQPVGGAQTPVIVWPDQCAPNFPLPGDPRAKSYGF